ncbi:hypothetical protein D3C80_1127660 [compost metagenome]
MNEIPSIIEFHLSECKYIPIKQTPTNKSTISSFGKNVNFIITFCLLNFTKQKNHFRLKTKMVQLTTDLGVGFNIFTYLGEPKLGSKFGFPLTVFL